MTAALPALTGDITTSAGAVATTLATVNSNVGTFGDATHVAQITVNGKGLITAASNVTVSGGGGSGTKTIAILRPNDFEPPLTNFAYYSQRNARPELLFDTTTQWAACWTSRVPEGTTLTGGLTVYVQWSADSVTSGTIGWDVAFERIVAAGLDTDGDSFGTALTITAATVDATSGKTSVTSVNFAQSDLPASLAAGDMYRIRIRRDVANDTALGYANFHQAEIRLQ